MNNQKGLLLPITSSTSNSNLLNTGEGGGEGGSTTQHLLPKEEVIRSYFVNVENFNNNQQYEPPPINLSSENELFILLNYVQVVGTGLDMFDINKCMVKVIPSKIKQVPALKYAIYALTSRYLETKVENYPNDLTIQLYHSALSHLLPSYNNRDKGVLVVTTCIILCVLEMMSSDPKNWSVYLSGCVLLLKSYKIDGFSKDDLERAIFWVFIRMDICYCVINECQGILGSEYYFDHERFKKIELVDEIFSKYDMWANYIVYLNSLIMNLIYSNKEGEIFKKEWLELWDRLSKWYFNEVEMELFRPVHEYFDEKIQFPRIFYSNSQAISANQMYHMGVIFMIQNKPRSVKLSNRQQSSSLTYHAKQIVGIGITNNDYGGYCNSVQPLYVAGLILTSKKEHGVLLSALRKVEECTGWSTYWRCRDLMNYWCGC
ncbi:hypothetical protein CANARDRAFT_196907 [[Candida] arabinofermentans NRRL YB-2248]|uniref:Transcription factor domain-containing protein n=1 Tax=[Candida] arabinofermentans NRRL YB-2248 TaxID=983967 RepID=A0A1E4T356_9ASCO|nr:hypothetical protein CANARDRAFT_196907 [[Candida] arabinofermentans NRRL YB-2248]